MASEHEWRDCFHPTTQQGGDGCHFVMRCHGIWPERCDLSERDHRESDAEKIERLMGSEHPNPMTDEYIEKHFPKRVRGLVRSIYDLLDENARLTAERDRAVELRSGDQHWARHFKAKADSLTALLAERDALARLAAAEAALRFYEDETITHLQGALAELADMDAPTLEMRKYAFDALTASNERVEAALAGSREQAQGEGA